MGSCNRTPPKFTRHPAITTPSAKPERARRNVKICGRASLMRNHTGIMEPIRCKFLLHKKERWKTMSCPRLPTNQQMDKKE
jgi:hypothetical protein